MGLIFGNCLRVCACCFIRLNELILLRLYIILVEKVEVFFFLFVQRARIFSEFLRCIGFLVLWKNNFLKIVKMVSVSTFRVFASRQGLMLALFCFLFDMLQARIRINVVFISEEFDDFISILITLIASSLWGLAFFHLHSFYFGWFKVFLILLSSLIWLSMKISSLRI